MFGNWLILNLSLTMIKNEMSKDRSYSKKKKKKKKKKKNNLDFSTQANNSQHD